MNPLFLLLFCGNNCGNGCGCRPVCDRPCVPDCDRCDYDCHEPYIPDCDCHEPCIPDCDCIPEDNCRECDDAKYYNQGRRPYPKDYDRRY